jgi:phage shock protein C
MKRLYRSRKDKIISGVCGGIGEYFGIDPVIIRIIAVVLFLWGGSGIIAYIIAMIIIPYAPEQGVEVQKKAGKSTPRKDQKQDVKPGSDSGAFIIGIVMVVIGGLFLLRNFPFFNDYYWWFKHQIGHIFWPAVLIAFGAFMIIRGTRK